MLGSKAEAEDTHPVEGDLVVRARFETCDRGVAVLSHAEYTRASASCRRSRRALTCEYEVPGDHFAAAAVQRCAGGSVPNCTDGAPNVA
jgi:hypothetical protein